MSLFHIAWKNFRHRTLSSFLTTLSLALGVGLVVLVLSIYGVIREAFLRNASVGPNLIIGAAGSGLQLTLNSVFYLSQPIENLEYTDYLDFLPQAERAEQVRLYGGDPKLAEEAGKYYPYIGEAGYVIPLALGDYFGPFRLVGTTPDFFAKLRYGYDLDQEFTFAEGRAFVTNHSQNSYFEAVLGRQVAKEMDVAVGDVIYPTHGDPEGKTHGEGFTVVGILESTGTPNDRAAFINLEGFYLMEGHARPVEPDVVFKQTMDESVTSAMDENFLGDFDQSFQEAFGKEMDEAVPRAIRISETALQVSEQAAAERANELSAQPLSIPEREVTALLVRTGDSLFGAMLPAQIKQTKTRQAASPIQEIDRLMGAIVGPLLKALVAITLLTCVVAAVGVLVAIYNSMNDRRRDIAVMRALGARRGTVTSIILMESLIIAVVGGVCGWIAAHFAIWAASPYIEDQAGIQVGFLSISSYELAILPLVIVLALLAGFLPAWSAYRTDVGANLSA